MMALLQGLAALGVVCFLAIMVYFFAVEIERYGEEKKEKKKRARLPAEMRDLSADELAEFYTTAQLEAVGNSLGNKYSLFYSSDLPQNLYNAITISRAQDELKKKKVEDE